MITKEENKLIQIKKRGKREEIYTYNILLYIRLTMKNLIG